MLRPPKLAPAIPTQARAGPLPLLVVVRHVADIDGPLAEAAGRARAAGRPLIVALLLPAHPLTTDAAIHGFHARLVADLATALTATVRRCHGGDVQIVEVRRPKSGRRRLARRIAALAQRHGAELHPPAPLGAGLREAAR